MFIGYLLKWANREKEMKKIVVLGVLASLVSGFVFAQKVLTVEDAINIALKNNLTIKQSEMDLKLLETKNKYSWNSASPSFSLSGGVSGSKSGSLKEAENSASGGGMMGGGSSTFADADPTLGWNVSGSLRLTLSPSLATSIKSAQLAYESGEMSYENTKRSIELSVRKTFYSLLYFNENIELQERSLQTAKQTYESNLSKYQQGRLSELNLLNSQYSYESKIPAVSNLKTTFENNLTNFKITLGINVNEEIELVGNLSEIAASLVNFDTVDYKLDEVPSIISLKKNIEASENSLKATKYSAYGPSISFSGGVGSNGNIKPSGDPSLQVSYSASVSIPLDGYMPWSNSALNIESQKEALVKQKQNFEQTKLTTEINIKNSINSIMQAKEQLALYEKNVELMQKTYDMTRTAYNAGSSDLLSLQNTENNLYQAKYNVQNQRYTIISAVLELENTLGVPFGTLASK